MTVPERSRSEQRDPRASVMPATAEDRAEVDMLLTAAGLPLDGLESCFPHDVILARIDGALVGVVGLERWGSLGFLRSVAVAESRRGTGIANALLAERLRIAKHDGLTAVYLLTTEARRYFERLGFVLVERTTLPAVLAGSTQLSLPACSTAVAMVKHLD